MNRFWGILITLLLGEFGVHRFLAGKIGTGFIWLCTGGLCDIGWLVDFIMVCTGSFKTKKGKVWAK